MKHIWKIKGCFCQKRENVVKLQTVICQKSQKLLVRTSMKGHLFRTFNSYMYMYSFNLKGGLCNCSIVCCPWRAPCPGGEQFLWFLKIHLLRFQFQYQFLLFFYLSKRLVFEMCLVHVRSNIANLCPIMSHFNVLDLSKCCSEEVISFFWRSV